MLDSFPQRVRSWLRANEVVKVETSGEGEFEQFEDAVLLGYQPAPELSEGGRAMARIAKATLDDAMKPLTHNDVVAELTGLRALTKSRASDGDDLKLLLTAYTQRLRAYPADVVREVLTSWANRETFFPSWAELKGELDRLSNWRVRTRAVLEGMGR